MRQRISVRDVAHAAGVAIGSVSRVLNDSGYASPELRRRVLEAVAKLGYEPDFTARHLRTGRSKTIGYLLPNIANPSLAAHLSEVERLTQAAGYSLLVGSSERQTRDRELVAFFENRRLEGIIASPTFEYPDPEDCPFAQSKLPVVICDRDMGAAFDSVLIDHLRGMRRAVDYLLSLGHRRIALFVSSASLRPGREKLAGYKASLAAAGIAFDERLVFMPNSWIESSSTRMSEMLALDAPPTAIIALGTRMLSGAVHVAHEAGLEIPRDLSVIGIGEASTLELMYPPLTMLRYNFERSAQLAVKLMMDRVADEAPAHPRKLMVDWDLVLGRSCAPARQR
ncbi:LacI family DNA-binding transcriptional regulator [Variovorax sp. UC122_21]|uniref:LacI family DNA-binding transcriptional regulator n=1 Tax=Variovorax sp. UC122_21 TaxID=3374554 RepID=UPI003757825E